MDEYGTEKPDKEELNIIMTGVVDNKPTDKLFIKERKAEIDLENSREFDDMFETLSNVKLVESKKAPQLH